MVFRGLRGGGSQFNSMLKQWFPVFVQFRVAALNQNSKKEKSAHTLDLLSLQRSSNHIDGRLMWEETVECEPQRLNVH